MIKLLENIPTVSKALLRLSLEVYENRTDHVRNNLRLNETFMLFFFQCYCKIYRKQLEIIVEATYGLHSNEYFEQLNLIFGARSLEAGRFRYLSNFRRADKIKDLLFSIDFWNRNTELLFLFSTISP